jgi:transposase, IS5 family
MAGQPGAGQPGFFDSEERLNALSAAGDPLERLAAVVDFEVFRDDLEGALARSDRAKGGRPPYDAVVMFKVLVLQTLYNLSDDQTEYQLKDRLSVMRFMGLAWHAAVPDAKTIWRIASLWRGPVSSNACLRGLMRCCGPRAGWRWAGKLSTPR